MNTVVSDYFHELFTGEEYEQEDMNTPGHRKVTDEQNIDLIADFTMDEFTLAIKQMHSDKASGPDGLNP